MTFIKPLDHRLLSWKGKIKSGPTYITISFTSLLPLSYPPPPLYLNLPVPYPLSCRIIPIFSLSHIFLLQLSCRIIPIRWEDVFTFSPSQPLFFSVLFSFSQFHCLAESFQFSVFFSFSYFHCLVDRAPVQEFLCGFAWSKIVLRFTFLYLKLLYIGSKSNPAILQTIPFFRGKMV